MQQLQELIAQTATNTFSPVMHQTGKRHDPLQGQFLCITAQAVSGNSKAAEAPRDLSNALLAIYIHNC